MRDIKFRALDIKLQEYYPVIFDVNNHQTFFELDRELKVTFEQFTGLKDKNGKEIYDGDIVEDVACDITYKVVFETGAFLLTNSDIDDGYISLLEYYIEKDSEENNLDECEVIGNIHKVGQ